MSRNNVIIERLCAEMRDVTDLEEGGVFVVVAFASYTDEFHIKGFYRHINAFESLTK